MQSLKDMDSLLQTVVRLRESAGDEMPLGVEPEESTEGTNTLQ